MFRHVLGGAGGWGDPAERDPQRVAHDVAEEKLSAEYACREYGMAIDPDPAGAAVPDQSGGRRT